MAAVWHLLVIIVLFAGTVLCYHDSEGSWDHVIHVNGTGNDSCDTIPCVTIDMALSQLSDSTVIYVNPGNHTLKQGGEITGKRHIAIIGINRETTIIHCESTTGLLISSSTDVTIRSITFNGCGYDIRLKVDLGIQSTRILPASVSFSNCSNVSIVSVTIQDSKGTGLLLHSVTDTITVDNCLVSGGYWDTVIAAESYNVGGIVFVNDFSGSYFITNSTIFDNNYMYNIESSDGLTCSFQSDGGMTFINSPAKVHIDSCYVLTHYNSSEILLDGGHSVNFNFVDIKMTDNLTKAPENKIDITTRSFSQNSTTTIVMESDQFSISLNYPTNRLYDSPSITFDQRDSQLSSYSDDSYDLDVGRCSNNNSEDFTGHCPVSYSIKYNDTSYACYDNHNGTLCGPCKDNHSVAINSPYLSCVPCNEPLTVLKGWALLIAMEFIPLTFMIAIIAILNVNLNQGSLSAYIFFCQMITIPFPSVGYPAQSVVAYNFQYRVLDFFFLPLSIWNLGFIDFPSCNLWSRSNECSPVSICISTNTTPLGAISFWYLIAFYPFFLLALVYACISMYDKGNKCIVFVFRPVHRLLARFWRIFNIQPSLTHTIASVYTLCFTQLAATSLKILHPTNALGKVRFFYDGSMLYFHGTHGAAATLALIVLIVVIIIPTVYLTIYPFKWFQKCFNKMKFKKDLIISVTDVFTGPYKDGTQNSWDYRCFAGIYFVLRMIIMICYMLARNFQMIIFVVQTFLCSLSIITIAIFRPYKKNIHTFTGVMIFINLSGIGSLTFFDDQFHSGLRSFFILLPVFACCYCLIWILKKCKFAFTYLLPVVNPVATQVDQQNTIQSLIQDDDEDTPFADRLMNPGNYD